jgi:hypothetical protein
MVAFLKNTRRIIVNGKLERSLHEGLSAKGITIIK